MVQNIRQSQCTTQDISAILHVKLLIVLAVLSGLSQYLLYTRELAEGPHFHSGPASDKFQDVREFLTLFHHQFLPCFYTDFDTQ